MTLRRPAHLPKRRSATPVGFRASGLPFGMGDIPRSVELKFARVGEHMVALDEAITTFLGTEPYGARRVVERDGLAHIFYWTSYEPCPDRFGLIAGDAIRNRVWTIWSSHSQSRVRNLRENI